MLMSCFSVIHIRNIIKSVSISVNGTTVHPVAQAKHLGVILRSGLSLAAPAPSIHWQPCLSYLLCVSGNWPPRQHPRAHHSQLVSGFHTWPLSFPAVISLRSPPSPRFNPPWSSSWVFLSTPATRTFSLHSPGRTFARAVLLLEWSDPQIFLCSRPCHSGLTLNVTSPEWPSEL